MRSRLLLPFIFTGILTVPVSLAHAEQTLQQRYLDIYVKIDDARRLQKQNDFIGALGDYKDCYTRLKKIHESDPNWETALVVYQSANCQAKIQELQPKADVQSAAAATPSAPAPGR
jgi:hypothetical protein